MVRFANYAGGKGPARSAVQQITLTDFSGGLHITESPLSLAYNECSIAEDVDFPSQGGVASRKGFRHIANTQPNIRSVHLYERQGLATQLLYTVSNGAYNTLDLRQLSAPSTSIATWSYTHPERPISVVMNGLLYLFRGHGVRPTRWNGTALTNMNSTTAEGWVTTTAAGGGAASNVPRAKCAVVWQNCLFTANLLDPDGTTVHANRIRWTWPDDPERTDPNYFEDIDKGTRNDEIVALVPHGERLLIFKRNSIHQIVGTDPTNFRRYEISPNIGAAGFDAVCKADENVYWYDHPTGVYMLDGNRPLRISTKIQLGLNDLNWMRPAHVGRVAVSWDGDEKIFVSASTSESPPQAELVESFVYNTRNRAWSKYSIGVTQIIPALPEVAFQRPIALCAFRVDAIETLYTTNSSLGDGADDGVATTYLCTMNHDGLEDAASGGSLKILSRVRFAPMVGGDPGRLKRWRRVGVVASAGAEFALGVHLDYDETGAAVTMINVPGASTVKWGSFTWGSATWSSSSSRAAYDDARLAGTSRAIEVLLANSKSTTDWVLSAVMVKYVARQRRE